MHSFITRFLTIFSPKKSSAEPLSPHDRETMRTHNYWLSAAEDIHRFRKGDLSRIELIKNFPELKIVQTWSASADIEDAIVITIPKQCPLSCAAQIVFSAGQEPADKRQIREIKLEVAYRPEWETLERKLLQSKYYYTAHDLTWICLKHSDVLFTCKVAGNNVKLTNCIYPGDTGDDYGFGREPDVWLMAEFNQDGEWIVPFSLVV